MALRQFDEIHIDEDCSQLKGVHTNGLFFNCKFSDISNLTLSNCDLNKSTFDVATVKDMLGFTVTLNCMSFHGVKLSPELFDMYLLLLLQTEGNDEKRSKIKEVIGNEKAERMLKLLRQIE